MFDAKEHKIVYCSIECSCGMHVKSIGEGRYMTAKEFSLWLMKFLATHVALNTAAEEERM